MDVETIYAEAKRLLGSLEAVEQEQGMERLAVCAAAGHPAASCRLAELLLEGGGDASRAADLLRAAAEAGHARAQFRLGLLYAKGEHVPADEAAAVRWCTAAARQGLGSAQFNLGLLHAAGQGVAEDPEAAEHWFRLASANGVAEAEGCLEMIHREPEARPATWNEAETRASVALARTDPEAQKGIRFAEYYVDPCIDLLIQRCRVTREQGEDIAQQFMLELEEPLAKGAHRGRVWKDSLRERFDADRGRFRPYLGRVLENFARDWLRSQKPQIPGPTPAMPRLDPGLVAEHHAESWRALLVRFAAAVSTQRPQALRAASVLGLLLGDGLEQAEAGTRLGISPRTVRSDLRLATELLLAWLPAELSARGQLDAIMAESLAMLPDWMHRPVGVRRHRALLVLALAERRLAMQGT